MVARRSSGSSVYAPHTTLGSRNSLKPSYIDSTLPELRQNASRFGSGERARARAVVTLERGMQTER